MSMSVEQIVSEARLLPREQVAELFDRLLVETFTTPDPENEAAWKQAIRRRIADIESGREPGVDGDEVMAELRKIVGR
ncbi:MAG: addiction module protein [Lacunisphaera sp.]